MNLKPGTAVAALLLIACGTGGAANNASAGAAPTPPADAAKTSAPGPAAAKAAAPAADLAGARALVDRIYRSYARQDSPELGDVYTPELSRAIARQSDPDVGLGFDPFCRCQDYENLRYTIRSLEPRQGGARAVVAFTNLGESHNVTLLLDQRNGRWLVADIREGRDSLLAGR
jgi:hypothetical protein